MSHIASPPRALEAARSRREADRESAERTLAAAVERERNAGIALQAASAELEASRERLLRLRAPERSDGDWLARYQIEREGLRADVEKAEESLDAAKQAGENAEIALQQARAAWTVARREEEIVLRAIERHLERGRADVARRADDGRDDE